MFKKLVALVKRRPYAVAITVVAVMVAVAAQDAVGPAFYGVPMVVAVLAWKITTSRGKDE